MTVSMDEIRDYAGMLNNLVSQARGDFLDFTDGLGWEQSRQSVAEAIRLTIADLMEQYGMPAAELGAQWYELCAREGGADVNAALLGDLNFSRIDARLKRRLQKYLDEEEDLDTTLEFVLDLLEDEIHIASRDQIIQNLDRDEKENRRTNRRSRAGYARVPVGDTCAWCIMLASRGYVYRSYESAGGLDPDHYHAHCDCVVVGYNDPIAIAGYGDQYKEYLSMYEAARYVYDNDSMSPELAERISNAKEAHDIRYANGELSDKWSSANEIAIIMREQNGLKH